MLHFGYVTGIRKVHVNANARIDLPTSASASTGNLGYDRAGFRAGKTGHMPRGPHQKGPPPNEAS